MSDNQDTSSESGAGDRRSPAATAKEEESSAFKKKAIRLLTVFAYVSSVSMAAVMLSAYYIFLWNPDVQQQHTLRADPPMALRAPPPEAMAPVRSVESAPTTVKPVITTLPGRMDSTDLEALTSNDTPVAYDSSEVSATSPSPLYDSNTTTGRVMSTFFKIEFR